MAKQNDTGVYQKSNGYWEYRFRQKVNGKMVTRKKTTDSPYRARSLHRASSRRRAAAYGRSHPRRRNVPLFRRTGLASAQGCRRRLTAFHDCDVWLYDAGIPPQVRRQASQGYHRSRYHAIPSIYCGMKSACCLFQRCSAANTVKPAFTAACPAASEGMASRQ